MLQLSRLASRLGFSCLIVLVGKFPIDSARGRDVQCFASGHAGPEALIIAAWDADRHGAAWFMPQLEASSHSDDQRMFRSSPPTPKQRNKRECFAKFRNIRKC